MLCGYQAADAVMTRQRITVRRIVSYSFARDAFFFGVERRERVGA